VSKTLDPLTLINQDAGFVNYLENATVALYRGESMLCEIPFDETSSYPERFLNESCLAEEGVTYTIKVSAPDVDEVFATDMIPSKTEIQSCGMSDLKVELVSDTVARFQFKTKLILEETVSSEQYYFLNLNYEEIPFQVNGNDTIFVRTGDYNRLDLESLAGNPSVLKHFDEEKEGGILFAKNSSESLELNFQVSTPNQVPLSKNLFDQIYVNLKTVSKSYYDYHFQLSRQLLQADTFFVTPVILADNIQNGYGLFGGYQLTRDSFKVE